MYVCISLSADATKYTVKVEMLLWKILSEYRDLQGITKDKSSQVFCWNSCIMKTFGSCHLIINRNPTMIVGTLYRCCIFRWGGTSTQFLKWTLSTNANLPHAGKSPATTSTFTACRTSDKQQTPSSRRQAADAKQLQAYVCRSMSADAPSYISDIRCWMQ